MSEEEIKGTLRLMGERISLLIDRMGLLVDILTRIEERQIEAIKEIEAEPPQGSFGTRDK